MKHALTLLIAAALVSTAEAETDLVVSAYANGQITITNVNADMFYTVAWESDLTGSNDWSTTWTTLQDMQATGDTIVAAVPMFYRVVGNSNRLFRPAPVRRTGQTGSFATGDDGDLGRGVAWPNPRFTDKQDGTVTDNLTGLIWLKNANAFGHRNWANALADCNTLNSGEHGLTDGSMEGDWRLPNIRELLSLMDYQQAGPALPLGHPFTNVIGPEEDYWTSTTDIGNPSGAWVVDVGGGYASDEEKTMVSEYVWPVRGGK